MLGREMTFTDRILVAGAITVFWTMGTGMLLAFANLLLLATSTLLGMSVAFPMIFGIAAALSGLGHFHTANNTGLLWCGAAILLSGSALASLIPLPPPPPVDRRTAKVLVSQRTKGLILGVLSAFTYGFIQWLLKLTSDPDFGPGPYATILMLSVGLFVATPFLNFFFMNIKLTGDPIRFSSYLRSKIPAHLPGAIAGVVFALGTLSVLLALSVSDEEAVRPAFILVIPFCSVLVCAWLGVRGWREFAGRPQSAPIRLILSLSCFVVGICITAASLRPWQ